MHHVGLYFVQQPIDEHFQFFVLIAAFAWWNLWFTPDQQGHRLLEREDYAAAAKTFRDPQRRGVAWYRAGEFEKAEQAFARQATPEAEYNRGNCAGELGCDECRRVRRLNPRKRIG